MTDQQRLSLLLYQLRFKVEDYINNKEFDPLVTFGYFLKQYVGLLGIKRRQFASDIGINETLLSQFIHEHRMPPDYVTIRLEIHSNNAIPATHWYKLVEKQREYTLRNDKSLRKKEYRNVRNKLILPAVAQLVQPPISHPPPRQPVLPTR